MAQPFLDFGDVGFVIEGIRRHRRAQSVAADLESKRQRVATHELVDAVGIIVLSSSPVRLLLTCRKRAPSVSAA